MNSALFPKGALYSPFLVNYVMLKRPTHFEITPILDNTRGGPSFAFFLSYTYKGGPAVLLRLVALAAILSPISTVQAQPNGSISFQSVSSTLRQDFCP